MADEVGLEEQQAREGTEQRSARPRRRRGRSRPRKRETGESAPLHQRSTSHFQAADRRRGDRYFKQNRVHLEVDGPRARARVKGKDRNTYGVGIDWSRVEEDRRLHVFCECERFVGGTPCKHIWATLLKLGDTHPKEQPAGKSRVGLRKDRATRWRDVDTEQDTAAEATARPARRAKRSQTARKRRQKKTGSASSWRRQFDSIVDSVERASREPKPRRARPDAPTQIHLLINTEASSAAQGIVLDVFGSRLTQAGKRSKLKRTGLDLSEMEALLAPNGRSHTKDKELGRELTLVAAVPPDTPPAQPNRAKTQGRGRRGKANKNHKQGQFQSFQIPQHLFATTLPELCEREALSWWDGRRLGEPKPLSWDNGKPWRFGLHLEFAAAGRMRLRGRFERSNEHVPLSKVQLVLPEVQENGKSAQSALVVFSESIGQLSLEQKGDLPWIELLSNEAELVFPEEDLAEALTSLLELPELPQLEAPEELQLSREESKPLPRLVLEPENTPEYMNPQLVADLSFLYGDLKVSAGDARPAVIDWESKTFARRDMDEEHQALVKLLELGLKPVGHGDGLELDPKQLPAVAEPLLREGWELEVHGTTMHPASPPALRVESGVDWFELSGQVDFAGEGVDFKKILEAISRGERTVELEDGSKGLLPTEMIDAYDSLSQLAQGSSDAGLRFLPSQAMLVDALLVAMPPVDVDTAFAELRKKLRDFESIEPQKAPRGFKGTLRNYQKLGLGWLNFLREFSLGGVLADDMGLGKTVQALALLKEHRTAAKTTGLPNLVVAPRSLVYNWIDEAKRFTPTLKMVEYSGPEREQLRKSIGQYDLVVTTYGTLRRDIGYLATVEFDTVILDEAQAIKNPDSQTAKASRLLQAENRLALTGTPIENHLGELGSIFEFLNPGLLGRMPALEVLAGGREASESELALVAKGIRPFILRRTKEEVLPDLPEKTEQILQCSMGEEQQKIYDQLRLAYRESLLENVEAKGVGGSAMQVLEALLRLRQVACHPGLVNEEWMAAGSAKLESLFEQVKEVLHEGHKTIIFSQFTKLLGFVRERFDEDGIPYAYLDGKTRKRAEVVDQFQTDPDCNVFLISLKAGGVGLNLTAASYVFLLDPWWNPAVEAQAIDRAHRIGQDQKVFAYRLIAQDTVEEKMIELQGSKRKLADAILDGKGQSLKDLTADDLRMLLS